jgi:hypothetical protein
VTRRAAIAAAAAGAALAVSGCGAAEEQQATSRAQPTGPPPPALPAKAVPYLDTKERALSAATLARETGAPGLREKLDRWGYQAGFARSFQGDSKRLKVVESRTLRFATARGATAFLAAVRASPRSYYPGGMTAREFASRRRRGIVVRAMSCSCHMANPAFLGVVARGGTVSWLEITGPRASVRVLRRLADQAP